ncbi:unnamed protein product [Symbiodinium microadriaticum]|nr:unnamed protein product [Symbiodinium microadriaticum]CAE7945465.1 unnamed protein product [Symbiodinium sp. KB8]
MSASQIQELFKKFDKDGNGRISASELQNVLTWINKDITVAEIGQILREVDTNNDGAIDYNEFVAWTQGGKKTLAKKKQTSLVPDLQAALERSQSEAAAVAAIPFDAVMAVTYTGEIKQFDKSGSVLEAMGVRTPHNQRYTNVEDDIRHFEKVKDPHKLNLNCFAVDWSSRNVVTASADHTLKMWNFYGNVLRTYAGHPSEVLCVDVDWKNHRMISGSLGSDLKMWRLDSSTPLRSFAGSGPGGIGCLVVNWKMHRAACGCGKLIELWDISSKSSSAEHPAQQLATFAAHSAPVLSLQVDWAEQIMVSASADKTLRRWNLRDAVLLETFPVGDAQIRCLSSPSSPAVSVLAGDEKGQIQVWDTKSGKVEMKMSGHTDGVLCISQAQAGFAVSGGRDGRICYWRLEDGACLRSVEVSEVCAGVWVVGVAVLSERADEQRKAMAYGRHGTFGS